MITYRQFEQDCLNYGWTVEELRCEQDPPPPALLAWIEEIGLEQYEAWALQFEREARAPTMRQVIDAHLTAAHLRPPFYL